MRISHQIVLFCMVSMASAIGENCVVESPQVISANKICTCISSQHTSMIGDLRTIKENLLNIENELELAKKKLKLIFDHFLIIDCEFNEESPQLCGVHNIKINKEKMQVLKVLVHESSFIDADGMNELEILHSNIKFIPTKIFEVMPALEAFTIIQSALTTITKGSFKGADNIQSITIEGNNIPNLGPNIFEGAETVLFLSLSRNEINTVSPDAFKGLKHLQALSLRNNNIKVLDLNVFKDNVLLRKLTFSHNEIEKVEDDLLKHNRELIYLMLNYNMLTGNQDHLTKYAKKGIVSDFSNQKELEATNEAKLDMRDGLQKAQV